MSFLTGFCGSNEATPLYNDHINSCIYYTAFGFLSLFASIVFGLLDYVSLMYEITESEVEDSGKQGENQEINSEIVKMEGISNDNHVVLISSWVWDLLCGFATFNPPAVAVARMIYRRYDSSYYSFPAPFEIAYAVAHCLSWSLTMLIQRKQAQKRIAKFSLFLKIFYLVYFLGLLIHFVSLPIEMFEFFV